jgi:hypothetical protein
MTVVRHLVGCVALISALVACGSDSKKGADAGALTDGGADSMAASGSGSGGSVATGSGGSSTTSGSGGSISVAKDGGTTAPATDGGGSSDAPVVPLPKDGNQLAVCTSGVDCNMGLDCYNTAGPSQGFCTKVCGSDDDCKGLSGGTYACQMPQGACAITCAGADDASCPAQMTCQQIGAGFGGFGSGGFGAGFGTGGFGGGPFGTGGFGGGTGGVGAAPAASFQCTYPDGAGITKAAAWGECTSMTSADCESGAVCSGITASPSGTGYCSPTCMSDDDCSAKPASGAITPTCIAAGGFGGAPQMRCVLDCTTNTDGCPSGMSCVPQPAAPSVGMGPGMSMGGMGTPTPSSRCEFD